MTEQAQTQDYLTIPELLRRLRISRSSLHKATTTGALPQPLKLGRCVRYRAEDIAKWEAAGFPQKGNA